MYAAQAAIFHPAPVVQESCLLKAGKKENGWK